ncbi:MAG: hypothetical protein CMF50_06410 [Legionellales bacterium]|nr:hypothetical protein [Legionellales bacterium]|tara:strand:- start:13355 stop:13759 length:405 start_codon:yes stop_codon:yes gene_type:complete
MRVIFAAIILILPSLVWAQQLFTTVPANEIMVSCKNMTDNPHVVFKLNNINTKDSNSEIQTNAYLCNEDNTLTIKYNQYFNFNYLAFDNARNQIICEPTAAKVSPKDKQFLITIDGDGCSVSMPDDDESANPQQ